MFHSVFFLLVIAPTVAEAFFCSSNNCKSCVSSGFIKCRWCRRDNKCHAPGAIATNPCSRAENIVDKTHCNDVFSHYDPELSYKMLLLSAAAYDPGNPQQCLNNALPSDKFQLEIGVTKKCDFADHNCAGYVAVSHVLKAIVVAFRGTETLKQALFEFIESLIAPKMRFLNGEVQAYWKRGFDLIWQSDMEAKVKALVSQYPSYQVWVTGHSLGGAIASLASTWLSYYKISPRKNIILYTFGMPRVGNYDYALQHDQLVNNSWRVINYDDAVPHFPTVASVSVLNGPYHHGVEAFYTQVATSQYSPHKECHGKPFNEDLGCSFPEPKRSIEHHKTYFSIPVGTFWETKCVPPGTA